MEIIRSKKALAEAIRGLRAQGKTVGLVPTMGALHDGHISLVTLATRHSDAVVATIFVNPIQFGPNEDFAKYPRTENEDIRKLDAAGVALIYMPRAEEMYPPGTVTRVQVPGINAELCGAFRPGHFDGVATIVTKLLLQAMPDVAIFGEKDYQQLHIISQMARDLDIPVRILGGPILREADGLAMSSRNRYLNNEERKVAASLYAVLQETTLIIKNGNNVHAVLEKAKNSLLKAGFNKVDYIELRAAETLRPTNSLSDPARLLAAAHIGKTRLIDNIIV